MGFLKCGAVVIGCCVATGVLAQGGPANYPVRSIRIVVPLAAGGPSDLLARVIGQKMTEAWGQQVIVENRPGANGILGSDVVAKSPADGYTLVMGTNGTHGINASLYPRIPYDTINDFVPVARTGVASYVLVAHPSLPVRSVKDLIALAKARPGELTWASGGSPSQLSAELFKRTVGIDVVVVPYKGNALAVGAVTGGEVYLVWGGIAQAAPLVKSRMLQALAVGSGSRSPALPDVPSMDESGVSGFRAGAWYGVFAPAGTPRSVVDRLNSEIVRILNLPAVRERLLKEAFELPSETPGEFAGIVREEVAKWAKVVKEAGLLPQ